MLQGRIEIYDLAAVFGMGSARAWMLRREVWAVGVACRGGSGSNSRVVRRAGWLCHVDRWGDGRVAVAGTRICESESGD